MTVGWRDRVAHCEQTEPLLIYQEINPLRYRIEGKPPVVLVIDNEVLQVWGPRADGMVTIHTTDGDVVYDVIGQDLLRLRWVAIRVDD